MKSKILGLLAVGLLAGPMVSKAAPITYTASATGTFALGNTGYENRLVTVTVTGDTDAAPSGGVQIYAPGPVTLNVAGVGSGTFSNADFAVFVVQEFQSVGFGRLDIGAAFLALVDSAASTYNLNQPFGPVTGTSFIRTDIDWATSLGVFRWRSAGDATFSATVSEPGTLALLGLGLAGLGLSRRRKA